MIKNSTCFLFLFLLIFNSFAQDSALLTLKVANKAIDSLNCTLILNTVTKNINKLSIPKKDNLFSSKISLLNSTFITISDGKNLIEGIIEPNDNISISYDAENFDSTLIFTGRGSGKFSLFKEYQKALDQKLPEKLKSSQKTGKSLENFYNYVDSVEASLLKRLDEVMFSISSSSYNLIKGEIKGMALLNKYYGLEKLLSLNLLKFEKKPSVITSEKAREDLNKLMKFTDSYYLSPQYLKAVYYILYKEHTGLVAGSKLKKTAEVKYKYLDSMLTNQLKIPVLSMFMVNDMEDDNINPENIYKIIVKTFSNNSTSEFKPYIEREYALFKVGKKAPDFTLEDLEGKKVSLNDLKGKVVYVNFMFCGNTSCQNLLNKLKIVKEHFKDNNNVVFLTVSIDSKEVLYRTVTNYKIQGYHCFTEGRGMEHPIISSYKVTKYPTSCIIDKMGNFYATLPPDNPLELIAMIDNALGEPRVVGSKRGDL